MMTAIINTQILLFNESRKRGLLILCIFLFPIAFTGLLFSIVVFTANIDFKVVSNETQFAKIETPINRSIVSKMFEIKGSLKTPSPKHSYFLVEYRNKRYWPKYALGNKASQWNKKLTHRADKNKFSSYQVVMVDASLKQTFDEWFNTSRKTGKYPGIEKSKIEKITNYIVANIKVKTK